MPRVTVCLPTHNRRSSLAEMLPTALAQTFSDFEIVVADDGSTDGTSDFVKHYSDSRVKLHPHRGRMGVPGIINLLLLDASAEFVAVFHDHDVYEPHFLAEAVRLLDKYPTAGFAFTGCHWIDDAGNHLSTHIPFDAEFLSGTRVAKRLILHADCPIVGSAIVVRRSLLQRIGGFRPGFGIFGDVDWYARLAALSDAAYVLEPGVRVRVWTPLDGPAKANWGSIRFNKMIRREALSLLGTSRIGILAPLQISVNYGYLYARQALDHWAHANRDALRTAISEYDLGPFHPYALVLRILASTSDIGGRLGSALIKRRRKRRAQGLERRPTRASRT
jgi:glycosyltransferase involved in cell wall biosynthesis